MTDREWRRQIAGLSPQVPEMFHRAMTDTLGAIAAHERNAEKPMRGMARGTKRGLVLALVLALLATAAVAAYHWRVFDAVWFFETPPRNADRVMQNVLHQETVNNVEITVREAGYDGRTLYLLYSYRMLDVDTPLGMYRDGGSGEGISEEDGQLLRDHGVGWWSDNLWFNGVAMSASGGSGGVMSGSTTPGELVEYEYWRLDNGEVALNGKVEISLPIGKKPEKRYTRKERPDLFDENGPLLPKEGVVTFTLDVGDMLSRVVTEHPNVKTELPDLTVWTSEVAFTPLMTYITLTAEPNQASIDAYIAEHGEGYCNEEGNLLWPYGGAEVYGDYLRDLRLVDAQGQEIFPNEYGNEGYGETAAYFLYPAMQEIPEELWLAPVQDGAGDMARAVRVR